MVSLFGSSTSNYGGYTREAFSSGIVIASVLIIVMIIILMWKIARYVIVSLSLFKIAKRRNVAAYGLAWVPFIKAWALGGIADSYDAEENKNHRFRIVNTVLAVVSFVMFTTAYVLMFTSVLKVASGVSYYDLSYSSQISFGSFIGAYILMLISVLLLIGYTGCSCICYYRLYELCKPEKPLLLLLLTEIVPFAGPFVLLSCVNWEHGQKVIKQPEMPYDAYNQQYNGNQYYQDPYYGNQYYEKQFPDNAGPVEDKDEVKD